MRIASIVFVAVVLRVGECIVRTDCECGKANLYARWIINGTEVSPNKYPWMVVMLSPWDEQICGGSIISDKNILSAGHCLYYTKDPYKTRWMVSVHNVNKAKFYGSEQFKYRTVHYEYHPKFRNSPLFDDYDMSIVTVDRPIILNDLSRPICLPEPNDHARYYHRKVKVAGWGKVGDSRYDTASDVLLETSVFLKTPAECRAMTQMTGFNVESMLCAHDVYTDACMGDSGGPLFVEHARRYHILLGVVSFGEGCATDFPGIYAKVDEELTLYWIRDMIQLASGDVCYNPSVGGRRSLGSIWDWITGKKKTTTAKPFDPENVDPEFSHSEIPDLTLVTPNPDEEMPEVPEESEESEIPETPVVPEASEAPEPDLELE